ncbi:hypothetical protein PCANC_07232 [Puccinia coronata f. sp. avenae]|uniref:CCHC-type domain-containing protein n=1 Tax=Puccinia coronata f. sp. avenae TaxID=200324 RepID=A0A2N5VUA4_9BASI|nr:hypothetical protein PCANC_07232 [Puccinia coronata f. sp. avenae]
MDRALTDLMELVMYADSLHQTPMFEQLLTMLDGCYKHQVQFSTHSHAPAFHFPSPAILETSTKNASQFTPQHINIDEADKPPDVSANAAKNNNCHICRQPGHWAADCPIQKKPPPNKSKWQPQTPNYPPQSNYNPYCPIFVAPNFHPYGPHFPVQNTFHQPFPQSSPSSSQQKSNGQVSSNNPPTYQHDSYRPNYAKPRQDVTARHVNVGDIEDELSELQIAGEMTANAISALPEIISDTGATNHLTGDKSGDIEFSWKEWNNCLG